MQTISIGSCVMSENDKKLIKLKKELEKVESELNKNRTSALNDGWQTANHSRKARNWDILAQKKFSLRTQIDELESKINKP